MIVKIYKKNFEDQIYPNMRNAQLKLQYAETQQQTNNNISATSYSADETKTT